LNVRKVNLSLWTLTAVVCAGGLAAAGVAIFSPVEVAYDVPAGPRKTPATSQASPDAQMGLDEFATAWTLNLRKPLNDSPGNATTATTQSENPATVVDGSGAPFVLVGTIGDSLAMVQTAAGVEIKSVGELANGAKIVAIRPWQVDVEVGGQRRTIVKPREPGGG
jgi:hypothetical protein